tara:strand:+ start:204 stop:461 length:258 start_codon:yes stop_codon:yes gene_type:complete
MCLFDPSPPQSTQYTPEAVKQVPDIATALPESKTLTDAEDVKAPEVGDQAVEQREIQRKGAEQLTINLAGVNKKKQNTGGLGGVV